MFNKTMQGYGEQRSVIRALFDYGTKRKQEIGEENVFDFSIGAPAAPAPPCVGAEIARLMRELPSEKLHGYTPSAGDMGVREAVAKSISAKFGVPMSANLVYMTCGASASLVLTLSAALAPGDEVIVPSPFFPEYGVFVRQAGGVLVPVATDAAFHPDLAAIGRAITPKTRAVLVNSPNNPTGAVYTAAEMRALGDLLREKSGDVPILLLADEPYRELCYGEAPVYPMTVYDDTVVLYSFSKSATLSGERIGYIAVSPRLRGAEALFSAICGAGRYHGYVCAPALFQRVVPALLTAAPDPAFYRKNRDLLLSALTGMGYECCPAEGAFYLFVKALEQDAAAFSERAKAHELLLVPSDSFGAAGYVRISYCVGRSVIEKSLPAFSALMEEYRG